MITTINEFKLVLESIKEIKNKFAYHVGNLKFKTDYLGDKMFHIKNMEFLKGSKTGHFGAGFFFFGKLENALAYQKIAKREILVVDFSRYNLFKPNHVEEFVESTMALTEYLNEITIENLTDDFINELAEDLSYFGIVMKFNDVLNITKQYVQDLTEQTNPKSDYIITRFLKKVGYEGIDFRNTKYDNFYLGSVLYDIKPETVKQFNKEQELQYDNNY